MSVAFQRGGRQARSTALGSGPSLAGVRGFESHPPHLFTFLDSGFDAISPTQNIMNRGVLIYKFSREIGFA